VGGTGNGGDERVGVSQFTPLFMAGVRLRQLALVLAAAAIMGRPQPKGLGSMAVSFHLPCGWGCRFKVFLAEGLVNGRRFGVGDD